jgi:hypothetical protein
MYPKQYFSQPAEVVPGSCFVLMPFAEAFDPIYHAIREAVCASDLPFTCTRADELYGGGHIIEDILHNIASAEVIIADVTSRNANVFYELGIAHMAKDVRNVIILSQSTADIPFDVNQLRCLPYSTSPDGLATLVLHLKDALRTITEGTFRLTVPQGEWIRFSRKLLGEDGYIYDFKVFAYPAYDSAKLEIDVFRHGINVQNQQVASEANGIPVGGTMPIPHVPWLIRLDRAAEDRTFFSVIPAPK